MHGPINVKSPNNISKWQMGFNSAFKGLIYYNNISSAFFSRTYRADAQLDCLKNNFKFALKLTIKGSYMFRCVKHHPQGAQNLSLVKVTIVKII
jgi:hypothetical protein